MTPSATPSKILQAIEAVKKYDREKAVQLLQAELRDGPSSGERWKSVAMLASQIGEIAIALEASRRFSQTQPLTLDRLLHYWGELAGYDRAGQALAEIERLPLQARNHPAILHFEGITAGAAGDFEIRSRFQSASQQARAA